MQKIIVEEKDSGKKLITLITAKYSNLKISELRKALRKKDIKINGKRTNKDETLKNGDIVEIYIADEYLIGTSKNIEIEIVYEDENILVINKPAGMEVTGTNSATEYLKNKYEYIAPCHRIDRNTIGLVILAKNENALQYIEEKFRSGDIEKHYIACCYGIPKTSEKTMEAYLFKDRKKSLVYISDTPQKGYVKITTSYKTMKTNKEKNLCILDVTLHTGRTHQIRAHLAHIGLPILGDGKYGSYEANKKYKKKTQQLCSYSVKFHDFNDGYEYLNGKMIKIKNSFSIYL